MAMDKKEKIISKGKKNRFSMLLEQLLTKAEIKNYSLAKELQYDVSYISKWVGGKMLPSEKNVDNILNVISDNVVQSLNDQKKVIFYEEYHVDNELDLKQAIFDHLIIEYNYVKDLKKTSGSEIAQKISYYPELTLRQFISKMRHPVIRNVKSLEIMAMMDILAMSHEYRLMILDVGNDQPCVEKDYPGVNFNLQINLKSSSKNVIYDVIFLINMLSTTHVNLQLYNNPQAIGRNIFLVKDVYSISGMLIDPSTCISVAISEDENNCKVLYHKLKGMCNRENILFHQLEMAKMIEDYTFMKSLISENLRWMIGHLTEHFLPENLLDKLLERVESSEEWKIDSEKCKILHGFMQRVLSGEKVNILLYKLRSLILLFLVN